MNIFIVAHSAIVRAGLEAVLRAHSDFEITGSAAEISAAPFAFSRRQSADVILINVEREKDFDDLREFLNDNHDDANETTAPPVIMLAPINLPEPDYALRALQLGVRGILQHDATANEIIAAIQAAANNLVTLSPEFIESFPSSAVTDSLPNMPIAAEKADSADEMIEKLTTRETEILEMLAGGASNKAIAFQLKISEHTVKFHVASIFGKFGVNTRTEAVTLALRRGLILL